MKKLFASLLVLVAMNASAWSVSYSCTEGNTNDTCKARVDIEATNEIVVATFTGGRLEYCNGWVETGCPMTGKSTVLNGEFTVRQLTDANFKLFVKSAPANIDMWVCRLN